MAANVIVDPYLAFNIRREREQEYLLAVADSFCSDAKWGFDRICEVIDACEAAKVSVLLLGNESKEQRDRAMRHITQGSQSGTTVLWSLAMLLVSPSDALFFNNLADGGASDYVLEARGQLGIVLYGGSIASAKVLTFLDELLYPSEGFQATRHVVGAVVQLRHEQMYIHANIKIWQRHVEALLIASGADESILSSLEGYREEISRQCELAGKASVDTVLTTFERLLSKMYLIARYKTVFPNLTSEEQQRGVELVFAMTRALGDRAFLVYHGTESQYTLRRMNEIMRGASKNMRVAYLITSRAAFERMAPPEMVKRMPDGPYPPFAFSVLMDIDIASKTSFFIIA